MICSSVNRDFFIRPSLVVGRTLAIRGGNSGGHVNPPYPICSLGYEALLRWRNPSSISRHLSPSIPNTDGQKDFKMRQQPEPLAKRTIRRHQLRELVPLADTTIYDMEQRGEFPQRFYLTSRCVVWDLAEVEAWLEERRRASRAKTAKRAPIPDVQLRKTRPIKHPTRA